MNLLYKISGSGKPLVLVPGGLTGWASWDPFIPHFSKSHKVAQVQLMSVQYGQEIRALPNDYSVRMESEALANTVDELRIEGSADFVGWSFGGFVLLDFALNNPGRIRTLTLIEPPAYWILKARGPLTAELRKAFRSLISINGNVTESHLELFMKTVGFLKPGEKAYNHPKWNEWKRYRQSLSNSPRVLSHEDNLSRLKSFNKPVLLVKGTGSAFFLHEIIDSLKTYLPDSKLIELPEGHGPHIVSTERFLEAVKKFQGN